MNVSVVTHRNLSRRTEWSLNELARVLAKLDPDTISVRLDPGLSISAATTAALTGASTHLWSLLPPDRTVEGFASYAADHRLAQLVALPNVQLITPNKIGNSLPSRKDRDFALSAATDTHVVVHDGRDRGSVLAYLQLVLGIADVVVIDPEAQRVDRFAPQTQETQEHALA